MFHLLASDEIIFNYALPVGQHLAHIFVTLLNYFSLQMLQHRKCRVVLHATAKDTHVQTCIAYFKIFLLSSNPSSSNQLFLVCREKTPFAALKGF